MFSRVRFWYLSIPVFFEPRNGLDDDILINSISVVSSDEILASVVPRVARRSRSEYLACILQPGTKPTHINSGTEEEY